MIDVGEVGMIPVSDVIVEDRARDVYGDIESLRESMRKRGLIQPLAVLRDNEKYRLLAGERRFIVLSSEEGVTLIPVRIFDEVPDELEMKSIELAENLYRKDFEYYESDKLIREIHELQQKVHGLPSRGESNDGWTLKDTAKLTGMSDASISTAIKRDTAREAYPDLFDNCKTQKDATKVIKRVDEQLTKDVIAKRIESTKKQGKLTELGNTFVIGSFFDGVENIPDGSIHLVEIDPPYAIDLMDKKKSDGESQYGKTDYNEVPQDDYEAFMLQTFMECYRVMTDHSWLICWFAPEPWFETMYELMERAGFSTTRMCGIWTKPSGQTRRPEIYLANSYEMFFYAWKGRPALNKAGRSNIFNFPPVPPQSKTHPTERPIELMTEIYDTFAFTGSRVLIPFLGSGNGLIAADKLGMAPTGFELTKAYRDSFLVKLHNMGM